MTEAGTETPPEAPPEPAFDTSGEPKAEGDLPAVSDSDAWPGYFWEG